MTEIKRSLTLADIDAAERKWREVVQARYRRERLAMLEEKLDRTCAELTAMVDQVMEAK